MSRSALQLADVKWTYRRVFTYGATIINSALLGLIVWKLDDTQSLFRLGLAQAAANIILALLYLAGATTTDITRLTVAARTGHEPEEPKP